MLTEQIEDDNPYANLEKKSKKGRKAEKNTAKPPAEKPLNHSLDIMGAFAKLSIEAPTSVSKVGLHTEPALAARCACSARCRLCTV